MGVAWPEGVKFPFSVQSDYSWSEIGALLRLINENKIGMVVETGVNHGDIAAWMISLCMFNTNFHYVGITCDTDIVDESVQEHIKSVPQAFIAKGLPYSDAILKMIRKYINNSFRPALVFCNGKNLEKEFNAYMGILRAGDVVCVSGFPTKFSLQNFSVYEREHKIKRVSNLWITAHTRLIAGVVQ